MIPATCCSVRSMLGAGGGGLGATIPRQLIRYNLTHPQASREGTSRLLRWVAPNLVHSRKRIHHHHYQVRSLHATAVVRSEASSSSSSSSEPPPPPETITDSMPPIQWTTHRLSQESIEKTDRIFHKILWLDFVETSELTVAMNQLLKLKLTPQQDQQLLKAVDAFDRENAGVSVGGDGDGTSPDAAAADAGPVLVDVKLQGFDAKAKIKVIKEVRALTALGLKEAKELVESAPTVMLKGLKPEAAAEIKAKLEAAGAEVELA